MSFNTPKKIAAGVASSALLLFGTATAIASPIQQTQNGAQNAEPQANTHTVGDREIVARWMGEEESPYVKVANAQGAFAFNQEGVTPNDELFNIFGAALTSMCSKPAAELAEEQGGVANYYVNVGGNIKKNFTVNVEDLSDDVSDQAMMACSCATGSPFGQVAVMGVPLSAVVEMADLEDGVNTVTAYGADGFGQPLPLEYALEKNALLVYQVNGEELTTTGSGSSLQLFMPETVARYFTRSIVQIELTQEEQVPDVQQVDPTYRNKINIMNNADECLFKAGDEITFEGVADDLGSPITAIEFSFDNGATWTSCETDGATADKWVNWQFTTSFDETGDYRMTVRAKTADGVVSPLEATLTFEIA
ncbi:molybdopterin-dependent oxidoreductase [Raoultibacter timonensis]|uniref:molybdopterin-dependent oxidoreductase n=1 Tax=Raoultibacter timonensis TaxID=1907662 RepID=UPI0026DB221D|nr:molybdopterin-dependent oxidoreductase [Raoultibacter timonensis]